MTINPAYLATLATATWIDEVEHHAELSSTQDRARAAAARLPPARSLLIIADRQSAGRGRGVNTWWTGEGNLAFSLLFDPETFELPRRAIPQVSLAAGVALVDAVAPVLAGHRLGLHWPNDVYVAGRKLAGVLVDVLPDGRHIVGVGVNTNSPLADVPAELRDSIATLHWLTGRVFGHVELLEEYLVKLGCALRTLAQSPQDLGARFDELCLQHGQVLTLRNGGERITGRCAGIGADGALLLDTQQGRRVFYSGRLH